MRTRPPLMLALVFAFACEPKLDAGKDGVDTDFPNDDGDVQDTQDADDADADADTDDPS